MPIFLGMSQGQVLKQTLITCCPLCKTEMEREEFERAHNECLRVDPLEALAKGLCPRCYSVLRNKMTEEFSDKVAAWIGGELERKTPFWKQPFPRDMEAYEYLQLKIHAHSPGLALEYQQIGTCRGLLDLFSGEFKHTTIEEKKAFFEKLKACEVSPTDVYHACVRYLEVISKMSYHAARWDIDQGWEEVFGTPLKVRAQERFRI